MPLVNITSCLHHILKMYMKWVQTFFQIMWDQFRRISKMVRVLQVLTPQYFFCTHGERSLGTRLLISCLVLYPGHTPCCAIKPSWERGLGMKLMILGMYLHLRVYGPLKLAVCLGDSKYSHIHGTQCMAGIIHQAVSCYITYR